MDLFRTFFLRHRALASLLVAAALLLKVLVPTGVMLAAEARTFTVAICNDASGTAAAGQMTISVGHDSGEAPGKPAKGECPYGALSMASLAGADVALLALALLFILALGFVPVRVVPPARAFHLRPPLRGPPSLI